MLKIKSSQDPVLNFVTSQLSATVKPKKIVLFGSRARGDAKPRSDYDIAVWPTDRSEWASTLLKIEENSPTLLKIDIVDAEQVSEKFLDKILSEGVEVL